MNSRVRGIGSEEKGQKGKEKEREREKEKKRDRERKRIKELIIRDVTRLVSTQSRVQRVSTRRVKSRQVGQRSLSLSLSLSPPFYLRFFLFLSRGSCMYNKRRSIKEIFSRFMMMK